MHRFLDLFQFRFPHAANNRELYFIYVSRNRCLAMFLVGVFVGIVTAAICHAV